MKRSISCIASAVLLAGLATALVAQAQPVPRRPRGIYAKVNIASEINQQQKANPSITPAQLNDYFNNLYQDLLGNPAISGLALQVHWDIFPSLLELTSNCNPVPETT